jgi:hypothetical protein
MRLTMILKYFNGIKLLLEDSEDFIFEPMINMSEPFCKQHLKDE